MTRHCLIVVALAVLAGCGPGSTLEVSQLALDGSVAQESARELNGTSVATIAPIVRNGCELDLSGDGSTNPEGCSNNGPFFGSGLAWVGLGKVTMADGTPVDSVTLQGTRFSGSVNGVQVSGEDFVGVRFIGTAMDGSPVRLRLDDVTPGPTEQPDVWRYGFSSPNSKGEWKPLCAKDHSKAVVVSGRWDYHQGKPGDGSKTNDPTVFTIGCRRSAIEKCINGGYKPWATVGGVSLDAHHQACVRLMRADYCGDGVSHTILGRKVNLYDRFGMQMDARVWVAEAEWTAAGARCLNPFNLSQTDAPCLPLLETKSCGEASSYGTDTLLISETEHTGGRDGH